MASKLEMRRPTHILLPLLSLRLLLFSSLNHLSCAGTVHNFNVGVILDRSTWIGNISWSCMAIAMEDFYAAHPEYTIRLALHPRDTDKDDALGAASAALDLLTNVRVQAIIGPQTSEQAKFIIELGNKAQVPIISFSAKRPSVSPEQSPYFVRTAFNDSSQAKVIASIVKAFGWREVVPVFEATDYGNGLVPYLADALQEIEARLPYRSSIPLSADKHNIMSELRKLKNMRTRVFVVHMSYALGFQLFSYAKEAGMMEEGYVWITTYGLTDAVDLMGSAATNVMQGVLGVKPYVRETEKLRDFILRWKKRFNQKNQDGKLIDPTVFGLWAYDAAWLLARAAKQVGSANFTFLDSNVTNGSTNLVRLGLSPAGPNLLKVISTTKFSGMSGNINLVNGQLESTAFEIINVVGYGKRRIGFWTPTHGISRYVDGKGKLTSVVWPGKPKITPKGWEWPINGTKLQIGVPVKPGFIEFVNMTVDRQTERRGYSLQVFDAVMKQLPYNVSYEYIRFADAKGVSNGTYDDLVCNVYLKRFDAVVGDVTIIANRSLYVDFTLPYTESGVSMLVPVKDKWRKNAWTFLDPLTPGLWLASGLFFVFTGFVVWILEHRINDDFRGQPGNQVGVIFYFSFSTLVYAHKQKTLSNLARVVLAIWVFVVLILQSSYTASLASMLTAQQLQPTVTDMGELIRHGYSVGYLNGSFMPGLLKRLGFNSSNLIAYNSPEEYHEALSSGTVAAIIDEIPYIKVFLSKYRSKYTVTGHTYKTDGFGFVFPRGSPLVPDVSRAILQVSESKTMIDLEKKLYGDQGYTDPENTNMSSNSLTFNSFWGLFLIAGVANMFALILFISSFLYKHRDSLTPEKSIRQRLKLLAELFDRREASYDALKKAEEKDETDRHGNMTASYTNSEPQSPTSISTHGRANLEMEEEIQSLAEDEGSLERDIDSGTPNLQIPE